MDPSAARGAVIRCVQLGSRRRGAPCESPMQQERSRDNAEPRKDVDHAQPRAALPANLRGLQTHELDEPVADTRADEMRRRQDHTRHEHEARARPAQRVPSTTHSGASLAMFLPRFHQGHASSLPSRVSEHPGIVDQGEAGIDSAHHAKRRKPTTAIPALTLARRLTRLARQSSGHPEAALQFRWQSPRHGNRGWACTFPCRIASEAP